MLPRGHCREGMLAWDGSQALDRSEKRSEPTALTLLVVKEA